MNHGMDMALAMARWAQSGPDSGELQLGRV